jgi:hypothetical protein
MLIAALLALVRAASAEDQPADRSLPRLGLSPAEPLVRSPAPSIPFGIAPATSNELVLDFHGYFLLPGTFAIHKIQDTQTGNTRTILHSPPLVPQDLRSFQYTGVVPTPWMQLNFTYGNSTVAATAVLAATQASDASGFYDPVGQLGVNDAFVSVNLTPTFHFPFELKVGALTGRYGAMGTYDVGRYGTPLIARTNSIGETATAAFRTNDLTFVVEEGLGGQLNHPPVGFVSAGWNDFAYTNVGASFVGHLHAGVAIGGLAQVGLHYLYAWTQDDQVSGGSIANGHIGVAGADAHITADRYGHLYVGVARTSAKRASGVSGVMEVLNARGGPELVANYLGPNSGGTGSLTTFGAQYDLSLARLIFGPLFQGNSTDIIVSLFGVGTKVESNDSAFDGVFKMKEGVEVTYNALSWFGVSGRLDHVSQDDRDSEKSFSIVSPRVLFHTGWQSRDEFVLQYSRFSYGSRVFAKTGYPPAEDPTVFPDEHVFSLSGIFWW